MQDIVGVGQQCRKRRGTNCVGANNNLSCGNGLHEEALMATVENSAKVLGKAGSDFFLPTSKKRIQLKQQKSKGGTHDTNLANKNHANFEAAPEKSSKKSKQTKEAQVDGGKPRQILPSKQASLKRKLPLPELSSQVDALADGDGAKVTHVCFDLRLEAKLAAEVVCGEHIQNIEECCRCVKDGANQGGYGAARILKKVEDIAGVQDKIVLEHSFSAKETRQKKNVPNKVKKEKDCAVVSSAAKYQIFPEREKQINGLDERPAWSQSRSKALILFEDVDIIFDEDRGFMGALLQLAETAKRPIILTSNRRDPNLPRLLDRLTVEFDLPSVEELLSHAFMVCVAEGVTISPSLVEHAVKCCCRDLRKTMMLLQFWCQGRNNSKEGRQLSPRYGSIVFELDAEHRVMPKMMPWGFPCKLSETINLEISKALDEAKQQEWLHVANQAEDNATRDRILAEIKNKNQKKLNEGERKSVILKRTFSADDSIQTFTTLACEVDQTSKVTQSSTLSLDQRVKRRRLAVVTSDSEDIPAVSETELQDADEEVSVESSSDSDEMAFPALDIPQSSLNWRDAREGSESNASVFKRLKRIQEVDFSEMNSLNNASCVPESPLVPETVSDGDALSQLESGNIGNASRCMERFLSNTCRPIGNTLELQNLNCGDKRQSAIPNLEDNGLSGPCFMTKSTNHCEIGADIVVGNEDFTASQTDGTSFDGGLLAPSEYEKVTDDIKSDLACCRGNEDMESLVKHSESNTLEGVPCDKSMETVYETLPLMDECSRADFASGFIESHQNSNLPTGNPVQETWKKMVNRRENLKSLLSSGCKDALSTIESAAKLTDLISSSDILLRL